MRELLRMVADNMSASIVYDMLCYSQKGVQEPKESKRFTNACVSLDIRILLVTYMEVVIL